MIIPIKENNSLEKSVKGYMLVLLEFWRTGRGTVREDGVEIGGNWRFGTQRRVEGRGGGFACAH